MVSNVWFSARLNFETSLPCSKVYQFGESRHRWRETPHLEELLDILSIRLRGQILEGILIDSCVKQHQSSVKDYSRR